MIRSSLYENFAARNRFSLTVGILKVELQSKRLKVIKTCDEQGAGFAADAYARVNEIGVLCMTYCVGGPKVVNAVAEAVAEKSSLIEISDAPGINERRKNPLLHHKVKDFDTQQRIFENITVDNH